MTKITFALRQADRREVVVRGEVLSVHHNEGFFWIVDSDDTIRLAVNEVDVIYVSYADDVEDE